MPKFLNDTIYGGSHNLSLETALPQSGGQQVVILAKYLARVKRIALSISNSL